MGDRQIPRILRWLLPADFVKRVIEPAYDDLRAEAIEQGQSEVGLRAIGGFVGSCLMAAAPRAIKEGNGSPNGVDGSSTRHARDCAAPASLLTPHDNARFSLG